MSDRKEEPPEVREPACLLCGRSEADPDICGEKMQKYGLCAHVFCLFFAKLFPQRNKNVGFLGLLPKDIQHTIDQAAQKSCFICGQSGATIACCEKDCDLSFHLPCAKQGGCVTQFIPPYRSFCPAHSPEQTVEATPEPGTKCLICMEPVEDRKTFNTMVCPACKTTWFHRDCIQNQAIHSGFYIFCCPHCQNEYRFLMEMFIMGIRIPRRGPSWEEDGAYGQLYERHSCCNASECLFPGGRPWELLLCSSCAAEGTHRHCSGLRDSTTSWECDGCAGLGTSSRDDSELSMDKQLGLEPSHTMPPPDTISPSTGSLVPSGLSHRSLAPEISSQAESGQSLESPSLETSSSSTTSQASSGSSCVSHDLESGRRSSSPGPVWIRHHSRLQRQAQNPHSQSGHGHWTCSAPSRNAGPDPAPPTQ
ncbi:PREDICTED: PHD finger protein 7-like isoform X2 [Lepidothrix coronata]|uniref:PHD finger protein 7-like isoform X2 n=1 Tax=Lepidothrix coronata TaxID=321398 RepID=A0A6J0HMP7_9PASS|nr:PREDICTED: PHD finger protein 7-like isoform X2 [Lepidothrix coronata]